MNSIYITDCFGNFKGLITVVVFLNKPEHKTRWSGMQRIHRQVVVVLNKPEHKNRWSEMQRIHRQVVVVLNNLKHKNRWSGMQRIHRQVVVVLNNPNHKTRLKYHVMEADYNYLLFLYLKNLL